MTKKQPAVPPTPSATTREELEARRNGVLATGPSGAKYRIRPVNLQRHALSGGLPTALRDLAGQIASGRDPMQAAARAFGEATDEQLEAAQQATLDYHDELVLALVLEPELTKEDLGTGELRDEALVPGNDYDWLLAVAKGEEEYDGEGKHLWGLEPLVRFATFREVHSCPPDCPGCDEYRRVVSAVYG